MLKNVTRSFLLITVHVIFDCLALVIIVFNISSEKNSDHLSSNEFLFAVSFGPPLSCKIFSSISSSRDDRRFTLPHITIFTCQIRLFCLYLLLMSVLLSPLNFMQHEFLLDSLVFRFYFHLIRCPKSSSTCSELSESLSKRRRVASCLDNLVLSPYRIRILADVKIQ